MSEIDDPTPSPDSSFPRKLDPLSIEALHDYITELEGEIERVRGEISTKEATRDQAENVFRKDK